MADTIQITAGSGTVVKTDQLADNTHVQYVKLLDGTADSAAVIAGDATSGLYVQVKSVVGMPTGASAAQVQGTVAHGAAAAQNPVPTAGIGVSAEPAVVDTGDVVRLMADLVGKRIVLPYTIPELFVSAATVQITNTASVDVIPAGGAGVRNYITSVLVQNSHATVNTLVTITDGSGGATLYRVYAMSLGGGAAVTLPVPLKTTANTALSINCFTTGASVYVSAAGYRGA